jgi:hypothetical protein
MEFQSGRPEMRAKILFFLVIFTWISAFAQETTHFYNVDTEIILEGRIEEIMLEPRYENTADFLVFVVKNKAGQDFFCEISPSWFFSKDFHKGEYLSLTGSQYEDQQGKIHVIARLVRFQGEMLVLRDKNGFPSWRGGKGKVEPKRRRKRF